MAAVLIGEWARGGGRVEALTSHGLLPPLRPADPAAHHRTRATYWVDGARMASPPLPPGFASRRVESPWPPPRVTSVPAASERREGRRGGRAVWWRRVTHAAERLHGGGRGDGTRRRRDYGDRGEWGLGFVRRLVRDRGEDRIGCETRGGDWPKISRRHC